MIEPSPALPLSSEEQGAIDKVIKQMVDSFKRQSISVDRIARLNQDYPAACLAIDKIIETAVDEIRPILKTDFIEKLHDRFDQIAADQDDDVFKSYSYLGLRLHNTLLMVVTLTKKYRGKPRKTMFSESVAKEQLKARGLWKK